MEIRKEIESLAIWYVPAFIIMVFASGLYSGYFKEVMEMGQAFTNKTFVFVSLVASLINHIDNIVLGIWLYLKGKKEGGRAILWLMFGIVAHFFAVIIYIGIKIYVNQIAYNKSLNQIDANDAPPG